MKADITLRIIDIKTHQWAVFPEHFDRQKPMDVKPSIEFRVDADQKLIGVLINIEYEQNKVAFAKVQNECIFDVNEKNWEPLIKDEKLVIPGAILERLLSIAIGTTRGVVHAKSSDTEIGAMLTPIVPLQGGMKDMEMHIGAKKNQ